MKRLFTILLGGALAATAWSAPVTISVNLNTAPLAGTTGSVLFSLGGFGSPGAATAEIFDFEPTAGLGAVLFDQSTTGSLPRGLTLSFSGAAPFAEHERELTYGGTLAFQATLSGTPGAGDPVSFVMILFDQFGQEALIATPGPPLLSIDYDPASDTWTTNLNAIPEPGTILLVAAGGIVALLFRVGQPLCACPDGVLLEERMLGRRKAPAPPKFAGAS